MFIPDEGESVRLASLDMYTERSLGAWTMLRVVCVNGHNVILRSADGTRFSVHADKIQPRSGWSETYMLSTTYENILKIRGWLKQGRGLNIWVSQDLSTPGRYMYTPGDVKNKPHWSVVLVERLDTDERVEFFVHEVEYGKPKEATDTSEPAWFYSPQESCWRRDWPLKRWEEEGRYAENSG